MVALKSGAVEQWSTPGGVQALSYLTVQTSVTARLGAHTGQHCQM